MSLRHLVLTALVAAAVPLAALADKPAHAGKSDGHGKSRSQVTTVRQAACPPGLAKKSPACVPPGQARKGGIAVGDRIDWRRAHVVTRPGLYGLNNAPAGQRYAIVNGRLMRVNSETGKILSIIRVVDRLRD